MWSLFSVSFFVDGGERVGGGGYLRREGKEGGVGEEEKYWRPEGMGSKARDRFVFVKKERKANPDNEILTVGDRRTKR